MKKSNSLVTCSMARMDPQFRNLLTEFFRVIDPSALVWWTTKCMVLLVQYMLALLRAAAVCDSHCDVTVAFKFASAAQWRLFPLYRAALGTKHIRNKTVFLLQAPWKSSVPYHTWRHTWGVGKQWTLSFIRVTWARVWARVVGGRETMNQKLSAVAHVIIVSC
jgi:hypothetical protein